VLRVCSQPFFETNEPLSQSPAIPDMKAAADFQRDGINAKSPKVRTLLLRHGLFQEPRESKTDE
jgi:hypothetical protein